MPDHQSAIADYLLTRRHAEIPEEVLDEARKCLLDWLGVSLAARREPEARILDATVRSWRSVGTAALLTGGSAAPAFAALLNGTLSHIYDFDDTHIPSIMHGSGPIWAALLAAGQTQSLPAASLLRSFALGFQVGATLGLPDIGVRLTRQGWHATPILGRLAATAALADAQALPSLQIRHAIGLAATQSVGLNQSFGTMAKPLHAGQAAMGAVTCVELAAAGYEGASDCFSAPNGLFHTLLQDPGLSIDFPTWLAGNWELLNNSFKPYAACQLTHAAIDAALASGATVSVSSIQRVHAWVHPMAASIANKRRPANATEGRFSLSHCIALGLLGHKAGPQDFSLPTLQDPALQTLAARIDIHPDPQQTRTSCRMAIDLHDGGQTEHTVAHAFGSAEHPMAWMDLEQKFQQLTESSPHLPARQIIELVRHFGAPGDMDRLSTLLQQAATTP